MNFLSGPELRQVLTYETLIPALQDAFCNSAITTPDRHHHSIKRDAADATLLLMPAWQDTYLGVKVVSIYPDNSKQGSLETIQGTYLLMDGHTGEPLIAMDAKVLTNLRTAATSALASKLLCNIEEGTMLMIGTGSLAPFLIEAHHAVHTFSKILVAGRSREKSTQVAQMVTRTHPELSMECVSLEEGRQEADLISVATLANDPILFGADLNGVQHIDLVGAYTPEMREVDDELISTAAVYIDTTKALEETGDLAIPLRSGVLSPGDIKGTLSDMCTPGFRRAETTGTTVFKSVGHASEDLVAAVLAYETLNH